eukprot:TRINITY_DN5823_c0_g1_i2.p1 TRINITY_DN5823_c0_g1~~TRINITY_DN5823_c0_g1_i2.p1  ORF type:complete len:311 (-),score=30.86 TRINITY_DN5823_c0_g1_i2:447-1379(-)
MFWCFSSRQKQLIEYATGSGYPHHRSCPAFRYFPIPEFLVDGGILLLSRYKILEDDFLVYCKGVNSDRLAAKGVMYAKICIPFEPEGQFIVFHLFTTHMQASYATNLSNGPNDNVRERQTLMLKNFIISKIEGDGFPIILMGDFNVNGRKSATDGADSEEYIQFLRLLDSPKHYSIVDLLKFSYRGHPVTVGDAIEKDGLPPVPKETALTNPHDWLCRGSVDYIFLLKRVQEIVPVSSCDLETPYTVIATEASYTVNRTHIVKLTVHAEDTKVQPFFVDGMPFSQLSDHYGVSTVLNFTHTPVPKSSSYH